MTDATSKTTDSPASSDTAVARRLRDHLAPAADYIRQCPSTPSAPLVRQADGVVLLIGPEYDQRLGPLWSLAGLPTLGDRDYRRHLDERLGETWSMTLKDIEGADVATLRALLTGLVRTERFVDGLVASTLRDGTLAAILDRIDELASQPDR